MTVTTVPLADPLRMAEDEAHAVRVAVDDVLAGGSLVLGPRVEAFEAELAAYLAPTGPPPAVVGVGNGTDALTIALLALDLPAGSAVLVAANDGGFGATAARGAGLLPVPVEADPVTQLMDLPTIEAAYDGSARADVAAAVVTHLHGQPVDVGPIVAWCRRRGIALVEDAAQAHGASLDGRKVGTLADAATFSFYPTKNLGALGDGGAVVTSRAEVAGRARRLRQYGWRERFRADLPHGRNSRLDALQAAVLSARLPFLDAANELRRAVVARYREALAGTAAVVLGDAPGAVAHHAVVLHADRDGLAETLRRHGVASDVHYPWLTTEMPGLALDPVPLPGADRGRREKLSLPCHPLLTEAELARVAAALHEWGSAS